MIILINMGSIIGIGATKMLKGEVYLWSGKQMDGGATDYNMAKSACRKLKLSGNRFGSNFTDVLLIIIRRTKKSFSPSITDKMNMIWKDSYRMTLVPQQAYMTSGIYF